VSASRVAALISAGKRELSGPGWRTQLSQSALTQERPVRDAAALLDLTPGRVSQLHDA
jgi:hypothetical protein